MLYDNDVMRCEGELELYSVLHAGGECGHVKQNW
jgi:hypothetical protein